ncbi:MAG: nucleoside phosphorylase [Treponema sp.]|nr:nucleoside phosphorylase [Treponema sp.]
MITEAFDNKTEELIKVSRSKDLIHVDACILTFSHEIFKYVLGNYECKKIGNFYSSNGAKSVYEFEYENRHFAFYMSCISAPLCVGEIESSPSVFNTDKFIMFGGAGCLNKEIARGKVMVPTEAYRDEGTSYHYAKATDYITIKNSEIVAKFMEKSALPYIKGKTWTTDAFFRETKGNFEKRKADGCISVEMEAAAVQAVCDFRGWNAYIFFTSGDLLDASEWTMRQKQNQKKNTQHDSGHFEIALELARFVTGDLLGD